MNFTKEISKNGVTERFFELTVAGQLVPGVVWSPDGAEGPRPLLMMGHGGSQHKLFPPFAAYGIRCARELRYAVVAIDAPQHGARTTPEELARLSEKFRKQFSLGQGLGGEALEIMVQTAAQAVPEWQAVLDEMQALDFIGAGGPVGYAGLSQGAMTGLALVACEPRIKAAVLGLVGLREDTPSLAQAARKITIPIEFLAQWNDELVPRDAALALFDAIDSNEKTLHANPGGHGGVPPFERFGWLQFFTRHLGHVES